MEALRKVDVSEEWSRIRLEDAAEANPRLSDALRATMVARTLLGSEVVRGTVLIVDRERCPRPRVPAIFVLAEERWGEETRRAFADTSGDVLAFVFDTDGSTWMHGLMLPEDRPPNPE
jgi:hypothetical protein